MIDLRSRRYALGTIAMVGMLAGCGGQANNSGVPSVAPDSLPNHKTFNYTGAAQDFKVPAGVTQLKVIALGAHGGGSSEAYGGRVRGVIPVIPGETLVVYVGGNGSGATGGFNGGGSGGSAYEYGGGFGGGGATDVRVGGTSLSDRIIVSGGGGGAGQNAHYHRGGAGGNGGGKIGAHGRGGKIGGHGKGSDGNAGAGGTQHNGGRGGHGGTGSAGYGASGDPGSLGSGGPGGAGNYVTYDAMGGGGGGGGGYYGGGGGGGGGQPGGSYEVYGSGGGGGGSSYAESSATDVHMWRGWKESAGNGLVVFDW